MRIFKSIMGYIIISSVILIVPVIELTLAGFSAIETIKWIFLLIFIAGILFGLIQFGLYLIEK